MTPLARLAAAALVAGCAAAAHAGWWDDAGAAHRATIEELRKDPDRWRDVTVTLDVRFARVADPGNPFFTRFTPKDWRAVGVFPADSSAAAMATDEPFARIFVRRGSEGERRLGEIAKGRSIQLRATVRDAVKGEPWIEVFDVVADGDPLAPEETAIAERAEQFLAHDNAPAAESLLRSLVAKRALPKAAQADVWRKIGAACWTQRRMADAAEAFTASLAADPDDVPTSARLRAVRAALASSARPVDPAAASIGAASIAPSLPAPPASFGTPVAVPARRLLPPSGLTDTPPAPVADPVPAPASDAPPRPSAEPSPAEHPAPEPAAEEPAPPPAPKPKLAGPR